MGSSNETTVGREETHSKASILGPSLGPAAGEKRGYVIKTLQEIKRCREIAGKNLEQEGDSKGATVCVSDIGGRERQSDVMQSPLEGPF